MFLSYLTSHEHRMADAYCGLQKSIRCGDLESSIYWAGQIGNNNNGLKGYPNALKKRLCQISLEDAASWEFASRLFKETKSNSKATFDELLPWVMSLVKIPKTHSTAWLQRVASQFVHEGGVVGKRTEAMTLETTTEIEFAASCLIAYCDGNLTFLRDACQSDGTTALAIYKFINNDPLVFHAWQMHQRRAEIRDRLITVSALSSCGLSSEELGMILSQRRELPDEWYDKHTKRGKKLGRGYEHFFEIMILYPRLYPLPEGTTVPLARGGCEPYEVIAKTLYLDFRIDGSEVKSKQLLSVRRSSSAQRFLEIPGDGTCQLLPRGSEGALDKTEGTKRKPSKRVAVEEAEAEGTDEERIKETPSKRPRMEILEVGVGHVGVWEGQAVRDVELLSINHTTKFLGFKNITCLCHLGSELPELSGMRVGDMIFVKMGEFENCRFALACEKFKAEVGLVNFHSQSTLRWLIPTLNYPQLVSDQHPEWARSIARHYASSLQSYSRPCPAVTSSASSSPVVCIPAMITGVFDGIRLCDGADSLGDGMELLKILLFRKYFGVSDTNATNLMIHCATGDLYSVDENPASASQLANYRSKGLMTSQRFHKKLCEKAGNALVSRPEEVGHFISQLKGLVLEGMGREFSRDRLREIHEGCPFDQTTICLLFDPHTERNDLRRLVTRLNLQSTEESSEEK
jgi:hypothetical protein